MTIQKLRIKNYQSHHDTDLELGNFTVLVGESSSGKSSIVRALHALVSNQNGKDFITHGQSTCQISAETDKGTVVLTKGKPEDSYVILEEGNETPKKFTKLGGGVPDDVTNLLGITPKDPINFAGQFDMPFLLRSSASEVARVLGDLTNVSVIFEASRAALTKRNAMGQKYKVRENDVATLEAQKVRFVGLEEQDKALEQAEEAINRAIEAQNLLQAANDAVMTVRTAQARLKEAQAKTDAPLPSLDAAQAIRQELVTIRTVVAEIQSAGAKRKELVDSLAASELKISDLNEAYDKALKEAGTCPTCNQTIG